MTSRLRWCGNGCSACSGTLRGGRPDEDLEEELRAHADSPPSALTAATRRPTRHRTCERRSIDSALEALRDQRGLPWLDALKSDAVFGWRQIARHRAVSASVRAHAGPGHRRNDRRLPLVDAVLLRPLPVADPTACSSCSLSFVDSRGEPDTREDFDYPTVVDYRDLLAGVADVMVVGMSQPAGRDGRRRPAGRAGPAAVRLGQCVRHFGLTPALAA